VFVKKVESDRDQLIERLLPAGLRARDGAAPPDACVDAETAAAWADDALEPRERATVETHAANCGRCQALLATLVRTNPPAPAVAWFRRPMLAWVAPLTAAAAALVVWTRTAAADAAAPAPAPSPSSPSTPPAAAQPLARAVTEPALRTRADLQQKERRKQESADVSRGASAPLAQASPDVVAPPAPAPFAPNKAAAPAPTAVDSARADQRVEAPAAAGAAPVAAPRALTESVAAKRLAAVAPPALIVSTNSRSRWLIGANGVVQHSTDGGSTWDTQQTGASVTLTTGASPSPSICWLVGPGGVVLLSTDGRSWQAVPFEEKVDLVSVRATDETSATVVAANGRSFRTTDRGRTWTPVSDR
jgi:hypothetical protein